MSEPDYMDICEQLSLDLAKARTAMIVDPCS